MFFAVNIMLGLVLFFGGFVGGVLDWVGKGPDISSKTSVELGLAELSPSGATGGYAVPASEGADPAPPPPPPPPTATLRVKKLTDADWTTNNIEILEGYEEIALNWSSSNASQCAADPATHFSTGGSTSGTDEDVTEPAFGSPVQYSVFCSNDAGTRQSNIITVTAISNAVDLTSDNVQVDVGDSTTLRWDVGENPPETCTLTGPGVNINPLPGTTGSTPVTIEGESTFELECQSGGYDSVRVRIIPRIFES